MRLSRFRKGDPYVQAGGDGRVKLAGKDYPSLEAKRHKPSAGDTDGVAIEIDLPEFEARRLACARDPLAVVEAFRIQVFLRLAAVLGLRMCPQCPRCNASRMGCQDKFGSNMRPVGGVLGGITAIGGGVEHQGVGTPHFHFEAHVVCAYQYGTLEDIVDKIKKKAARSC